MIGIFDSGIGGKGVLHEIVKLLPDEHYIYFADTAYCPYGEKTREFVVERARSITRLLLEKGSSIIVVACNTATAAAINTLRSEWPDIPFVGIEPAVKPAALASRSGVIGVLATKGTLKQSRYLDLCERYEDKVSIVEHVGEGFVELVENGILDGPQAEKTVRDSVEPLINAGADTILLGCTHYPFLRETIQKVADSCAPSRGIRIIDPAPAVAAQVLHLYTPCHDGPATEFLSSSDPDYL